MSATERAMVVSVFIMCLSFGIIITNEMNAEYNNEMGRKLINYEITPPLNYSDIPGLDDSKETLNSTINDITEFNKPAGITFDFAFWQSIKIVKIFTDMLMFSVWGFPAFLAATPPLGVGMPVYLVIPIGILINLSHLLLVLFLFFGKKF